MIDSKLSEQMEGVKCGEYKLLIFSIDGLNSDLFWRINAVIVLQLFYSNFFERLNPL